MEGRITLMQSRQMCLHIIVMMAAMQMVARAELSSTTTWVGASNVQVPFKLLRESEKNLSEAMWDGAVDLLPDVWRTRFISGVKDGTLDANFYGAYLMQNAAWCKTISNIWKRVADNETAPQALRPMAERSITSFLRVAQELWSTFTVEEGSSSMGTDAANYANFVSDSVTQYGAPYIMIATFACSKLWANITEELYRLVEPSSPFYSWILKSRGGSNRRATFIDTWAAWYDRNLSITIFRNAMHKEIEFFNMTNAGVAVKSRKALHGEVGLFDTAYIDLY